jgi:predicted Zn-ribbon and HTH transcriptional regulator
MATPTKCPKCDSKQIIPDAYVREQSGHTVELVAQAKPEAKLFKKGTARSVRAMICGACGYVELSVSDPRDFYAAYRSKSG